MVLLQNKFDNLRFWRKKRPAVPWLICSVSFGILAGAVLANYINIFLYSPITMLTICLAVLLLSIFVRSIISIILFFLVGLIIGVIAGGNAIIQQSIYSDFYGKNVQIKGKVLEDTSIGTQDDIRFKLTDINLEDTKVKGTVWVSSSSKYPVKRGDIIFANGKLEQGFGTISASMYRAEIVKVERPVPGDIARQIRDSFTENVFLIMPEKEASLGASYLTGQKQLISDEFENDLRNLGLIHLAVASGYHLTIIVGFCRRFFASISRYYAVIMSLLLIWSFLLVTGFTTSMQRAAIVTVLSLVAWYYGRVVHPVVLLVFVASITVLIDPKVIMGDVGWYLSFASFAGVIILAPLIEQYFWGDVQKVPALRRIVVATLSAQIATFPIIAFTFAQYSPLALLSNLLILPFVPLSMVLTLIAGLLIYIMPFMTDIVGYPAYFVLKYMTIVSDWLVATPWSYKDIKVSFFGVVLSYLLIIVLTFYLWKKTGYKFNKLDALN